MSALVPNRHILVDASAGDVAMTLPTGAAPGDVASVEKVDASAHLVPVTGSIRGVLATTLTLKLQHQVIAFKADASGSWWPISGHLPLTSLDGVYAPQPPNDGSAPDGYVWKSNGDGTGAYGAQDDVSAAVEAYLPTAHVVRWGNALGNTQNLNSVVAAGRYERVTNAGLSPSASGLNYPISVGIGVLDVDADSTGALVTQNFRAGITGGGSYSRFSTNSGGTWSPWATLPIIGAGTGSLDLLTMNGRYWQPTVGSATLANNYPVAAKTCIIDVIADPTAATVIQEVRIVGSTSSYGLTYRRELSGGVWGAWVNTTTQQYVDAQIASLSGAASPYKRNAGLYPVSIALTDNINDGSLPVLSSPQVIDLTTASNAADYFSCPISVANRSPLGNTVRNAFGIENAWHFGITADCVTLILTGSHRVQADNNLQVFVNGEPVDRSAFAVFPAFSGHLSAVLLQLPYRKIRNIEVFCKFELTSVTLDSGTTVATPYKRYLAEALVPLVGDSWLNGTSAAPDTIASIFRNNAPYQTWLSAYGGSGFTQPGLGTPYTDASRLGVLATALAAIPVGSRKTLVVGWGSVNDAASSTASAVSAAAHTFIDSILSAKSDCKVILTGAQKPGGDQVNQTAALQAVVASYASTNITFHNALDFYNTGAVASPPDDDGNAFTEIAFGHPAVDGARAFAEWLEQIVDQEMAA